MSSDGHWIVRALGPLSKAGTPVNEHKALTLTAAYSAISIIADAESQLPIDVIRRQGERKQAMPDHSNTHLLNVEPNPWMTAFTFRNTLQAHALQWGNGYAEIQRNGRGDVVGLWPLLPDRTAPKIERNEAGQLVFFYETQVDGQFIPLAPKDVLHIPGMGFDGLQGYSPIYLARQAVGLGIALEEFGSRFFSNDTKSGGFIKHPGTLSQKAKDNLRESMESQGGLDQAHRTKILEEGMEYQPITIAPEDAQFLKTREFQVEEIARLYRVPLWMLQNQSKDTTWGTGIAQQSIGFTRYTVNPWLNRWDQEINRKMFSAAEQRSNIGVRHDVSELLRADAETRAKFYNLALDPQKGWMRRNEVRRREDMNPLEEGEWQAENPQPTPQPTGA